LVFVHLRNFRNLIDFIDHSILTRYRRKVQCKTRVQMPSPMPSCPLIVTFDLQAHPCWCLCWAFSIFMHPPPQITTAHIGRGLGSLFLTCVSSVGKSYTRRVKPGSNRGIFKIVQDVRALVSHTRDRTFGINHPSDLLCFAHSLLCDATGSERQFERISLSTTRGVPCVSQEVVSSTHSSAIAPR